MEIQMTSPPPPEHMDCFLQTEIPPTNRINYITGIYALNIPDQEGTTGDWHDSVFWHPLGIRIPTPISLGGKGAFDTNQMLGDMGVQEAHKRVVGIGLHVADYIKEVYVANRIRATLDLAFSELSIYGRTMTVRGASSDWLDTAEQKETLLRHAATLASLLVGTMRAGLDDWIVHEKSLD
jgi:hypothetical protein